MAEGAEVGKAYITISLEDTTEGDYEVIKSRLEAEPPVSIKASMDAPDVTKAREEAQAEADAEPDVKIKAKVDEDVLSTSLKTAADDAVPAAEAAGAKLGDSTGKSAIQYGSQRMGEMATVYTAAFLALSPGIGGALISGVALGTIGIAALLDKSNAGVAAQYTQLANTVKTTFTDASSGLVGPITDAVDKVNQTVHTIAPGIEEAFGATQPAVGELANGIDALATNALPGFEDAARASGTVMNGLSDILGDTGTAFTQSMSLFSSNSTNLERSFQSFGTIIEDVLDIVSHVANDASSAWSAASNAIDPALHNISSAVDGLASGALPVLGQVLKTVASDVSFITQVLGPLTPIVGGAAAAFLAFKGVTSVVSALGSGITSLGSSAVSGADKIGSLIAGFQKLPVEASESAGAVMALGDSVAATTADVGMMTSAMAGPLGIALLAGTALISLFATNTKSAGSATTDLSQQIIQLGTASVSSAQGLLAGSTQLQGIDSDLKAVGSSAAQFSGAFSGSIDNATTYVNNLTNAQSKLGSEMGSYTQVLEQQEGYAGDYQETTTTTTKSVKDLAAAVNDGSIKLNSLSPTLQQQIQEYNSYANVVGQAQQAQKDLAQAQQVATTTADTAPFMNAESGAAQTLGLKLSDVVSAYEALIAANPSESLEQISLAFQQNELKVDQATSAITTYFQQQDAAVATASQSLISAQQGYQQSISAVANAQHSASDAAFSATQAYQSLASAQHSVVTSQQAMQQADQGVISAQQQLTTAQLAATQAQVALNTAEQTAAQNLINLRLQLNDQVESEQAANLALYNQTIQSAAAGVTAANAQAVAAETITSGNAAQIQAALDLISAQDSLADSQNTLTQTQQQNATAQQEGVNGNPGVVSAQQALVNAQLQVVSATDAVTQAQQSQQNAAFSLQQAVEGVTNAQHSLSDAEYAAQQAEEGITQAKLQEANALGQVTSAQKALTTAQNAANTSLTDGSVAAQNNRSMLFNLASSLQSTNMPIQQQYNDLINASATFFGGSTTAAQAWLKQIGLISPNYNFTMTAEPVINPTALQSLENQMHLQGTLGISGTTLSKKDGGPITGPGGPRDDSIVANVSNGEFVVNADATSKNLGLLEHINAGRFADGGLIEGNVATAAQDSGYQITVDAMKVFGLPAPPDLPAYVPGAPAGGTSGSVPSVPSSRAANEAIVQSVFASMFGWSGSEWDATIKLLMQESGFDNTAQNPTSTAYGMFQFLNSTWAGYGIPKTSDPTQQSIAGGRYIKARYGDPLGAEAHEQSYHWFESGGYLPPGATMSANGTGKPEMVLPPSMTSTMEALDSVVSRGRSAGGSGGSVTQNTVNIATIPQNPSAIASAVTGALTWTGRSRRG